MTISENALIKRINRKLIHDGEQLHVSRCERCARELGWFYIRDNQLNIVTTTHCNIEFLALELGVLREGEALS